MSLTRDQILGLSDRKIISVSTPEWGEGSTVFIRTLSGAERDELDRAILGASKDGTLLIDRRARFCASFICDEEGAPLFTQADIDALTGKSSIVLDRIVDGGLELNAMREKDAKELEKN